MTNKFEDSIYDNLRSDKKPAALAYIAIAYLQDIDPLVEVTTHELNKRKILSVLNNDIMPFIKHKSFDDAAELAREIGAPEPTICLLACLERSVEE